MRKRRIHGRANGLERKKCRIHGWAGGSRRCWVPFAFSVWLIEPEEPHTLKANGTIRGNTLSSWLGHSSISVTMV